jgi:hypothetical protein
MTPRPAAAWPTLVSYYAGQATPLTVGGGTLSSFLLSPAADPFGGTTNAAGIYSIDMTANGGSSLTITNGRVVGTLLVTAAPGATVNITGPVSWQPTSPNLPALIISGTNVMVNITGSASWLSESALGQNLNPAGSPYDGVTNATRTDDYPPQVQGLVYVTGSGNAVRVSGNACLGGTLICDGTVEVDGPAALVQCAATYAAPPVGFAKGDAVAEVPGTWRWDTLP